MDWLWPFISCAPMGTMWTLMVYHGRSLTNALPFEHAEQSSFRSCRTNALSYWTFMNCLKDALTINIVHQLHSFMRTFMGLLCMCHHRKQTYFISNSKFVTTILFHPPYNDITLTLHWVVDIVRNMFCPTWSEYPQNIWLVHGRSCKRCSYRRPPWILLMLVWRSWTVMHDRHGRSTVSWTSVGYFILRFDPHPPTRDHLFAWDLIHVYPYRGVKTNTREVSLNNIYYTSWANTPTFHGQRQ